MKGDSRRQENLVFSSLLCFVSEAKSYRSGWHERNNDMSTLIERYALEGRGFLAIGLSDLGKSLDKALQNQVPLCCRGFKVRRLTCLPDFLFDLFDQVFDREDGFVLPPSEVNPNALRELRQVLFYGYKEEYPFTREHEAQAVRNLRAVDDCLPGDGFTVRPDVERVIEYAARLVGDLYNGLNLLEVTPSHGPGSVATYEKPHEKMDFRRLFTSVANVYPYQRYMWLGWHHLNGDNGHFRGLERVPEPCSRMALALKDARGPRTISLEPLEVQWMQQGQKDALYDWIENHPLTKGKVNFSNQEVNRRLARLASIDGRRDTVDLKDASNSNSLWLVRKVHKYAPHVLKCLEATRSTHMKLLDGDNMPLRMFAPMGSATCFPVEAVVFWALTVACLAVKSKLPSALTRHVWVYGDDIILPHGCIDDLMYVFSSVGLKINEEKSCTNGHFRESCGMDAFYGNDVTPLKVKLSPPSSRSDAASIVSWTERGNMFVSQGYPNTARTIFEHVEGFVGELPQIPLGDPEVGFLHKRATCCKSTTFSRKTRFKWDPDLQSWMADLWTWGTRKICASPLRNWSALLLSLTTRGGEDKQTEKFALPKTTYLRKGWVVLHGMPAAVKI